MNHGDSTRSPLSPEGQRRKEAILATAEQALAGRVRAARTRRSLAALTIVALAAAAALRLVPGSPTPRATIVARPADPPPAQTPLPSATVAIERLDDDSLQAELAALGFEVGLIEVNGDVRLVDAQGRTFDRGAVIRRPHERPTPTRERSSG